MLKFVVRRAVWTIPVILLVIFFTFVMMRQIKGNPVPGHGARGASLDPARTWIASTT